MPPIDLGKVFNNSKALEETIEKFKVLEAELYKLAEEYGKNEATESEKRDVNSSSNKPK